MNKKRKVRLQIVALHKPTGACIYSTSNIKTNWWSSMQKVFRRTGGKGMKYKKRLFIKGRIDKALKIAIHRASYNQHVRREAYELFYSVLKEK